MAITKNYIHANRATPITYWKYAGMDRFVNLKESDGHTLTGPGVVILLDGYINQESRDAARENGRGPDQVVEFLITNWVDPVQEVRPATVEEKKAKWPGLAGVRTVDEDGNVTWVGAQLTEEGWAAMPMDIVVSEQKVPHNDYNDFRAALLTGDEDLIAKTAYEILKRCNTSANFFDGALDV